MESQLFVENKGVVVPGMVLAKGMDYLPSKGTYRRNDQIIANRLGLVQLDGKVIKTVPLAGRYLPKKDDIVIGRVTDVLLTGWRIEINSPYESVLTLKEASSDFIQRGADLTRYFALNDWVVCQIVQVTSQNLVDVSVRGPGLRKLIGGTIISVNTHKVPRIIGKRGSMVSMIKRATDCNIVVGQNGRIWMNGKPESEVIAIKAIEMISQYAHIVGLTERVKSYLESATGREISETVEDGSSEGSSGYVEQDGERREHGHGNGGGYRSGGNGPQREFRGKLPFRKPGAFRRDNNTEGNGSSQSESSESSEESQ